MIRPFSRESHTFADPPTAPTALDFQVFPSQVSTRSPKVGYRWRTHRQWSISFGLSLRFRYRLRSLQAGSRMELSYCAVNISRFSSYTLFSIWRSVLSTSDAAPARRRTGRLDYSTYGRDLPRLAAQSDFEIGPN